MTPRTLWRAARIFFLLSAILCAAGVRAQESPAATLAEALVAACRQNEADFARYLTEDNAAVFRTLPASQRTALLQRFSLLEQPGRPLLSSDAQGHSIVRCESLGVTTETRLGEARGKQNLAFVPIEVRVPPAPGSPSDDASPRRTQIGLVREDGGWKLLSVGLLLINLAELSKQWAASELEAKENEAIQALRDLARALGTFRRAFGKLPESLAQLGPAPKEGISPDAAGLVDAELASSSKGGYVFRYRILPAADENGEPRFELAAAPSDYGKTGRRSFFLDARGVLRGADKHGEVATAADPPIEPR